MKQEIVVQAPTRIDFAGGTLDIPPLYLFHQPCYTVNAAITVFTRVRLKELSKELPFSWQVISQDLGESFTLDDSNRTIDLTGHPLELPLRFVAEHGKGSGVIATSSDAPRGSGIGGSSSLGVALQQALDQAEGIQREDKQFLEPVKSIETQSIRVPTGYQDYLAAYYKGLNVFSFGIEGIKREPIEDETFLRQLEEHLFLVYTTPHFSGMNNWELFKRHIDQDPHIVNFFERLRGNAEQCRKAFLEKNIAKIAHIMTQDWEDRKAMIPSMSTPVIEEVIERAARAGALGWRVCGAGGGGCIAFLVVPEQKGKVTQAIQGLAEARIIPCGIAR